MKQLIEFINEHGEMIGVIIFICVYVYCCSPEVKKSK